MAPTLRAHGPWMEGARDTAERGDPVLVAAAGTGARPPGLGAVLLFRRHRATDQGVRSVSHRTLTTTQGRVRAVLAGACLMVLLTGCSLDVDTLRENIETHWSGVEKTTPTPSTLVSSTPATSGPAVVELPAASGSAKD